MSDLRHGPRAHVAIWVRWALRPQPESLHVPRSAVLLAGGNSVIYVETQPGRFEIRPVKIGPILGRQDCHS